MKHAKVLAVSFPDLGDKTVPYINSLQSIIESHSEWQNFRGIQLWQTDGRPMSGDIGKGTSRAAITLAKRVLEGVESLEKGNIDYLSQRKISFKHKKHFVQLAGGTNDYSVVLAKEEGLIGQDGFGGYAFGGYARKTIGESLRNLEESYNGAKIENFPHVLKPCLDFATNLVSSIKSRKAYHDGGAS